MRRSTRLEARVDRLEAERAITTDPALQAAFCHHVEEIAETEDTTELLERVIEAMKIDDLSAISDAELEVVDNIIRRAESRAGLIS